MKSLRRHAPLVLAPTVSMLAWGVMVSLISLRATNLWWLLIDVLAWAATHHGEGEGLPEFVVSRADVVSVCDYYAPGARVTMCGSHDHLAITVQVGWRALIPFYARRAERQIASHLTEASSWNVRFVVEVRR